MTPQCSTFEIFLLKDHIVACSDETIVKAVDSRITRLINIQHGFINQRRDVWLNPGSSMRENGFELLSFYLFIEDLVSGLPEQRCWWIHLLESIHIYTGFSVLMRINTFVKPASVKLDTFSAALSTVCRQKASCSTLPYVYGLATGMIK